MDLIWNGNRLLVPGGGLHIGWVEPTPPPTPSFTEIVIGTQTWALENVPDNIPGSKVYYNNEANRTDYGGLYTHSMIASIEALYPGWRVPLLTDFNTLKTFVAGGDYATAGGKLKEVGFDHWLDPNTGAVDLYGFRARGGGFFDVNTPLYLDNGWLWSLQDKGVFMMNHYDTGIPAWYALILYYDGASWLGNIMQDQSVDGTNLFSSVRLIKN